MAVHVFGIRHHGPGCARSLRDALRTLEPDIVLVEGPPDAHAVLPLLMHERMQPPVALLIYAPDQPQRAVFYPFTHFSPEWQALRYAFEHQIPARFIDLPQAIGLAQASEDQPPSQDQPPMTCDASGVIADAPEAASDTLRDDPIGMLAAAAGYTDHELWWEHQIEQRQNSSDLFEGIM